MANVKLPRRSFLQLAAGAAALPALPRIARAQAYPTKPVRIIVPFAPAGGNDILARLIGQSLSERLGQQFVIENRPGANSNIGTEAVSRAPADGYTLLLVDSSPAINATLYDKLSFNFIHDMTAVATVAFGRQIMVAHPSLPARSIAEFITYERANPGRINFATAGQGNVSHLAGELFNMMTGSKMVHIPYRGTGPALTDLIAGQVQVMFGSMLGTIEYVRSGKLRALAVTTAKRSEALPNVPTVGEFVKGYEVFGWYGIYAAKETPRAIVETLNSEINAALADSKIAARLADLGVEPMRSTSNEAEKLLIEQSEKWGKVILAANIKPE